jgi:hypothetical protein
LCCQRFKPAPLQPEFWCHYFCSIASKDSLYGEDLADLA